MSESGYMCQGPDIDSFWESGNFLLVGIGYLLGQGYQACMGIISCWPSKTRLNNNEKPLKLLIGLFLLFPH